jgi:hypothetical protein
LDINYNLFYLYNLNYKAVASSLLWFRGQVVDLMHLFLGLLLGWTSSNICCWSRWWWWFNGSWEWSKWRCS